MTIMQPSDPLFWMHFTIAFVGFGVGMMSYAVFGFCSIAVGHPVEPRSWLALLTGVIGFSVTYVVLQ